MVELPGYYPGLNNIANVEIMSFWPTCPNFWSFPWIWHTCHNDMLTEIIKELTTIKRMSKQVLALARRVEVERAQEALIKATKENTGFNTMTKQKQKINTFDKTKAARREMHINCEYCSRTHEPPVFPECGRNCSRCRKPNHFGWVCRCQSRQVPKYNQTCREVHYTWQDDQDKEVAIQEFGWVRSTVFNFHSIRSVIIAKLKTESSQKVHTCKYKIYIGRHWWQLNVQQNVQNTLSAYKHKWTK